VFDVGLQEIFFIAIIAVIVFGPDRLPDLARQAARFLHTARGYARRAQQELRDELGPEYSDLSLRELDPRVAIKKQIREALADLDAEERRALLQATPAPEKVSVPPFDSEAT
jgi:sec-independent protein translocase protein TatB